MSHDIFDITIQNIAQSINSIKAHNLVMHQLVNQGLGEVVFLCQPIFSYPFFPHGHPELIVSYHYPVPLYFVLVLKPF